MRYVLDKTTYQRIKKYDYNRMNKFLSNLYKAGYEAGGLTSEEVRQTLLGVRGIGPKRMAAIVEALEARLDEH